MRRASAGRCGWVVGHVEIKGTNSKKEGSEDRDHISDLTFQKLLLEFAGVAVGRTHIVHLNKEYVRAGSLDIKALFIIDDSTEQVERIGRRLARRNARSSGISQPRERAERWVRLSFERT